MNETAHLGGEGRADQYLRYKDLHHFFINYAHITGKWLLQLYNINFFAIMRMIVVII
jgi:hypothetical protein